MRTLPTEAFRATITGAFILTFSLLPGIACAADSTCYGTPSKGRLEHGVRLPESGSNFGPYSVVGVTLGRTYVHARVAEVVATAYDSVALSSPGKTFLYGESGFAAGGRIAPHRTHQNGLAVDFMVPVLDRKGRSVPLPTSPANKFGYGIDFDASGRYGDLQIDFEALAEHLFALHRAAQARQAGLARVIIEPAYIPKLYRTSRGEFMRKNIAFMRGQAWVRHDEHYHVDFALACKPLATHGG